MSFFSQTKDYIRLSNVHFYFLIESHCTGNNIPLWKLEDIPLSHCPLQAENQQLSEVQRGNQIHGNQTDNLSCSGFLNSAKFPEIPLRFKNKRI